MTETAAAISRPQRWDVPFGPDMTEADVDRVLGIPPFSWGAALAESTSRSLLGAQHLLSRRIEKFRRGLGILVIVRCPGSPDFTSD